MLNVIVFLFDFIAKETSEKQRKILIVCFFNFSYFCKELATVSRTSATDVGGITDSSLPDTVGIQTLGSDSCAEDFNLRTPRDCFRVTHLAGVCF